MERDLLPLDRYVRCFVQAINELKVLGHPVLRQPLRTEPPKFIDAGIVIVITQRNLRIGQLPVEECGHPTRDYFIN